MALLLTVGSPLSAGTNLVAPLALAPATELPATLESLRRELAELKEGQRQLAEQLQAIRKLLEAPPEVQAIAPISTPPPIPPVITQNVRGEPYRGAESATVAMIEYSDFNCSHCAAYATNIFPSLDRDYIQTGKIRYLFRDLPDRLDSDSLTKAQAARCAGEQGKFWEMHDRFFQHKEPLLNNPGGLVDHANALGLDPVNLNVCIESSRYAPAIQMVSSDAKRFGMHGTPSFLMGRLTSDGNVINGTRVMTGAESYEALKAALDEVIAESAK